MIIDFHPIITRLQSLVRFRALIEFKMSAHDTMKRKKKNHPISSTIFHMQTEFLLFKLYPQEYANLYETRIITKESVILFHNTPQNIPFKKSSASRSDH